MIAKRLLTGFALAGSMLAAQATPIVIGEWTLGENDGSVGSTPGSVDASVGDDFSNSFNSATVGNTGPLAAPGSSAYLAFTAGGFWNADVSGAPTDNVAVELWARASGTTGTGLLFTSASSGAWLDFQQRDGNWAASINGVSWIGGSVGAGQPIAVNTWTHLALIRENGVSTFYINGVAQSGATPGNVPAFNTSAHLGFGNGAVSPFSGDIDDLRIFSFDPNTDDPVAALSVNNGIVPEPSSLLLLGLGGLALIARRRARG